MEIPNSKTYNVDQIIINKALFFQWIVELICLAMALHEQYNHFYQQLYYIKLAGLIDYYRINCNKQDKEDPEYTKHFNMCMAEMHKALSDRDFIYLIYRRHSAAHVTQDSYNLYDKNGILDNNPKGKKAKGNNMYTPLELHIENLSFLDKQKSDYNADLYITKTLYPTILKLHIGLEQKLYEYGLTELLRSLKKA